MSGQGRPQWRLRAVEAALDHLAAARDEAEVCRELAAFLVRSVCDAAAVEPVGAGAEPGAAPAPVATVVAGEARLLRGAVAADGTGTPVRARDGNHPLRVWTADTADGPVRLAEAALVAGDEVYGRVVAARSLAPHVTPHVTPPATPSPARSAEGFDDDALAVLHFAVRLAGVQLGWARRLAAVERSAVELQRALVSEPGRPHPNLEVASRYLPLGGRAVVGGDWFEAVRLHFGRTLLVVGDVMGHGLDAAVDMNAYRAVLREIASTDLAPHRVLRQMDALSAADEGRRPATCLLARIDPARGTAVYAGAGHLPPVLFDEDGTGTLLDVPVGPPLGTGLGGYEALARPIGPGQTLLLYTDGLVERRGEDIDVSLARLTSLRVPGGLPPAAVVDAVCAGLDAHRAEDDVAVVAARLRPRPAHPAPGGPAAPL
ncbi:PP2C family protein-serine/threonine phosphatase [Streptomyces sp. NPDC089922]|uniref:PP2C family protein-serine/threonine phosphatase n=1 Tax=Streptomyces sp. NPDC089922 TaxID=3155189 RepID=UPI003429BB5D